MEVIKAAPSAIKDLKEVLSAQKINASNLRITANIG
jgi:hypothetical protein